MFDFGLSDTYRIFLEVVDLAVLNAVLDRLKTFGVKLADSIFADACHKAVLRSDLEIFVFSLRYPLAVLGVQALDPGWLLVRSQ